MRIVIHGTGGVGGYFGACLAHAGHEVFFIARGKHLEAIKNNGLLVKSHLGGFHLDTPHAGKVCDPDFKPDLVIVGVKSWQLQEAGSQIKKYCLPDTLVLPLQNGVNASDLLAQSLGKQRVLGGLTKIFSKIDTPGIINHFTGVTFIGFGDYFSDPSLPKEQTVISDRCIELENLLDSTEGIDAKAYPDIKKELWRKILLFGSTSGIGSVTRTPNGIFRDIPETRKMLIDLMHEILKIGQGQKVNLGDEDFEWAISTIDSMEPESNSSLFRDIEAKKPSELYSIHGYLLEQAERLSVEVPTLSFIYHSLIPQESLVRQS